MNRLTILKLTGCDLKRLPLGAREAFFLSQLDGRLTVEEIAEVAGVELDEALRLAKLLVELGAVATLESRRPPGMGRHAKKGVAAIEAEPRAGRVDPRAERDSIRPQARKRSLVPPRSDKRSLRPGAVSSQPARRATPRPERRSSRKSLREQRAVPTEAVTESHDTRTNASSRAATAVTGVIAKRTSSKMRQLRTAAMEIKVQANIELLAKAADDALRANDVVGAANNLRLALSHREDPHLRKKYEEIDARARVVRFEKNIAPARAAEREQRWADAAVFLVRAHEARPDADVAARAANALRLSGGNLRRAIALAEQAIALDGKSVAHHITLTEAYLAANRLTSAEEALAIALELAPKDVRAREIAAEIARRSKQTPKGA
jgi:Tetratricopeptide repeat